MIYRLGKKSDLNAIVNLHFKVRDTYSVGYFSKMGKAFIRQYYRIVLEDPYAVFIVAEEEGKLCGFCSASTDVNKQFSRMQKYKWLMGLCAIPSFIYNPTLIKETWKRYKATKGEYDEKYLPKTGARVEYWTWNAENKNAAASVSLFNIYLRVLYDLGVKKIHLDVDKVNEKVLKFHLMNKAVITEDIELSDGRSRSLMEYDLKEKFSNKKK